MDTSVMVADEVPPDLQLLLQVALKLLINVVHNGGDAGGGGGG